jgi:hypothetical protein
MDTDRQLGQIARLERHDGASLRQGIIGTVKNGVVVFADGKDENGESQLWIERVGDLRVSAVDAFSTPGGTSATPKDIYHRSEIIDGVQHYKKEVLTYSPRQNAWGAEYVGDYVFIGGDYVPFSEG